MLTELYNLKFHTGVTIQVECGKMGELNMLLLEFGDTHECTSWCLLLFWKFMKAESLLSSSGKKMETTTYQRMHKKTPVVPLATTWDMDSEGYGVRGRVRTWRLPKGLSYEGK